MVALSAVPDLPVGFPTVRSGSSPAVPTDRIAESLRGFPRHVTGETRMVVAVVNELCPAHFRRSRVFFYSQGYPLTFGLVHKIPRVVHRSSTWMSTENGALVGVHVDAWAVSRLTDER